MLPHYSLYISNKITKTIAADKLNITQLQSYFKSKPVFGTTEITAFYKTLEPKIKATTVNWRVFTMVQSGVLSRIGRGKYTLGKSRNFIPHITAPIKKLYNNLHKQFPYLQICIWNTSVLNELMLHQPGRFYTLIEVEKEAMENVFFYLKENKSNVFLDPTAEILSHYASSEKDIRIITPLVSEAPTQNVNGVLTVCIEKILVDIFSDEVIFAAQQGSELENIFKEAFSRYTINESKMLRYADRRRKKELLNKFLNRVSKFRQQAT